MNRARAIKKLETLYSKLPAMQCKGLCHDQCTVIGGSALEIDRLREVRPDITFSVVGGKLVVNPENLRCPLLRDGRCTAYAVRPAVCRLWGLVPELPCPHGCTPQREVTSQEGFEFMSRVMDLGGWL